MAQRRPSTRIIPFLEWRRAGLQPYQIARLDLVARIEALVRQMALDSNYPSVLLSGQTIVLNDYLELYPHAENRIAQLIRSGRLEVGPWYVLPDVRLVSPEAIIRNLRIGQESANHFGR